MDLRAKEFPMDGPISSKPDWDTSAPPRKRANAGQRLRAVGRGSSGIIDDGAAVGDWDAGGGLESAAEEGGSAPACAEAAAGGGNYSESAANVHVPWAAAASAVNQQKWNIIRLPLQRSYVQHVPSMHALREKERAAACAAMERSLAEVPPHCFRCSGVDMQQEEPVRVLYIATDARFQLAVPRYSCRSMGCDGMFAPSPFAAGCFPATPKVSWDVAQASPAQPARWIDLRLLQLADGLLFQAGRGVAVHSFAAVVHHQHELNGCADPLGWEHFKRQLGEALMVSTLWRINTKTDPRACNPSLCQPCHRLPASPSPNPPMPGALCAGIWLSHVLHHAAGQAGGLRHPDWPTLSLPLLRHSQPSAQHQHRFQLHPQPPGAVRYLWRPPAPAQ